MLENVPLKKCTKCGSFKPATTEFFNRNCRSKDGFHWWCKLCAIKHYKNKRSQYYKNNSRKCRYTGTPDQQRLQHNNERAKRLNCPGELTYDDIKRIRLKQDKKCLYCGKALLDTGYTIDHFIPLTTNGSTNTPDNIVLACPYDNRSKKDKLPWKWIKWNGAYPVEWGEHA